jgi:alpha/beta superfamily hydrolase
MTYDIQGPAGRLEARLDEPEGTTRAVAVIAPPHPQHGGTFQDRVVYHLTQGLLRSGCAVLRFNFRGSGTSDGTFDGGAGEQDDFRAALDAAAARYPSLPLWAVGYSFGAHVALAVGAQDARVSLLVGVAILVDTYDFSFLIESPKAKFLIHGERDAACPALVVRRFYAQLAEPRELVIIDGADHFFDGHASEVADAIEDLVVDFPVGPAGQEGDPRHA